MFIKIVFLKKNVFVWLTVVYLISVQFHHTSVGGTVVYFVTLSQWRHNAEEIQKLYNAVIHSSLQRVSINIQTLQQAALNRADCRRDHAYKRTDVCDIVDIFHLLSRAKNKPGNYVLINYEALW